jgi:predicted nuclease of restriction endonuclease-like (RecB) superfamily
MEFSAAGVDGRTVPADANEPPDLIPVEYVEALAEAKRAIRASRTRSVVAVNTGMMMLYWNLGNLIANRETKQGWGAKIVERLSNDLRAEFPGMTGLSFRNLRYMRDFALAWSTSEMLPQAVATLPWGHNRLLLDKLNDVETRFWYAQAAIEYGWSRNVLENQIMSQFHRRAGVAPTNFSRLLPAEDSEMMQQATRDPYHLEFLTIEATAHERDVEQAMIDQLDRFLRELGRGFSYVARQWRLDVAGDEFFIDLLMFHADANRYVVLEIKHRKITPADVGQLNFYIAVIDDTLRRAHHNPTIGLLLCSSRNEQTVRYALDRATSPMAVAGYRYTELPPAEQAVLPGEQELLAIVIQAFSQADPP